MGSWNSLVERVRSMSSEPRSGHDLGAEQLAFMSGMLDKAVRFRKAHPELEERWVDVDYLDLMRDIYGRFGWGLAETAMKSMLSWQLKQAGKRRAEIRHSYQLEDFGLTPESVDDAFGPYLDFIASRGIW